MPELSRRPFAWSFAFALMVASHAVAAQESAALDALEFDDRPLRSDVVYPDWFKFSFLNLREDLSEAVQGGKRGLVVYFGQARCPYCRNLMEINFKLPDIAAYTQKYFDVVAIDILGNESVTDLAGAQMSEREFALRQDTTFTPSLVFYDSNGMEALRLRGYYPPYRFRAALEYVAGGHYLLESFRSYLERADPPPAFDLEALHDEDFFQPGPYMLDRSRRAAQRPLLVAFEQGSCHACDVLHGGPLRNPAVRGALGTLEAVQLDMWADTPVMTPAGSRLTARAWAEQLGLFYAPTLIFFDGHGKEIIRVDSVVQFYRLQNVLDYVRSGAYREEPNFQRWRASQRGSTREGGPG